MKFTIIFYNNYFINLKFRKEYKLISYLEDLSKINILFFYPASLDPHKNHKLLLSSFKKIFRDYFLKSFSTRLVEYKEAKIVVISEDVKNDKYTIVKSKLLATSNRPEVAIDWRVYTKNRVGYPFVGQWRTII